VPQLSAVTWGAAPLDAALAPLRERLGGTPRNGLHPGLLVRVAPPAALDGTAPGWIPGEQLVDGTRVPELIYTARQRWLTEPHVAAALAWKAYTYWLALPAVASYAIARRVPLLRAEEVLVQLHDRQPFLSIGLRQPTVAVLPDDPLAASPSGVAVVPDEAALLAALRSSLLDAHLDPVLEQIRARVHLGRRTLLGSVASGIAYGLVRALAGNPPESTVETTRTVLAALGLDRLVDLSPTLDGTGVRVWRRTCCLAFKLPEPKICSGCVLKLNP